MKGDWDGDPWPNAQDDAGVWERRLWWYLCMALLTGAGVLLGEAYMMTRARASSTLDTKTFRPNSNQFQWLQAPHGAGVATCELVVEGYDMLAFRDQAAAHACLRNKSIVMVGDSVTRYQYLNFVNMLENGHWMGPDPQLEDERQWEDWSDFYQGTNARFNGREVCDCFREEPATRRGNIENRYYYNEEIDVRVTYFQWFTPGTGHLGHDMAWLNASVPTTRKAEAGCRRDSPKDEGDEKGRQLQQGASASQASATSQTGCRPGECDQPADWDHDIYGLFAHVVPLVQPDVLVFNHGIWGRLPGDFDLVQLTQAAKEAVRASGGRVIYKTTTALREGDFEPEYDLKDYFQGEGITVLDAGTLTSGVVALEKHFNATHNTHLYWDKFHFYAPVYAGLNTVLLNLICPA